MPFPAAVLDLVRQRFAEAVPHNAALGLRALDFHEDGLVAELPYSDKLVGNPESGFIHGGAITSLIDATCGMAVPVRMMRPVRIATLDLRIDYLKPAKPGLSVFCRASCYKLTRQVAFVRAIAHCSDQGDESDPVAAAAGTFVIFAETDDA